VKKIWFYPILGSLLLFVWGMACNFLFPKGSYAGFGCALGGIFLVLSVFPIWFAWYAGRHTKLVIIPALYTAVIFLLPWSSVFIKIFREGITYYERPYVYILTAVFVWNVVCFAVMRLYRFLKSKRIQKSTE